MCDGDISQNYDLSYSWSKNASYTTFNGENVINCGDSAYLPLKDELLNFEIEFDFYHTTQWGWSGLSVFQDAYNYGGPSDECTQFVTGSSSYDVSAIALSTTYVPYGTWARMKIILNNNHISLYINGTLKAETDYNLEKTRYIIRGQSNVNRKYLKNITVKKL